MRVPKKYTLSPVQIFLSIMTKHKIIGRANHEYFHKTCMQINGFFKYPLIDHAQTKNYNKKNVFIASKDHDITNDLIELIDNQIKTIEIK